MYLSWRNNLTSASSGVKGRELSLFAKAWSKERPRVPRSLLVKLFLQLILSIAVVPASAQNISIGIHDNINTLYLTANQGYIVSESLSESGDFTNSRTLLEKKAGDRSLIRSSPGAANPLLIASEPDMVTTSRMVKISCSVDNSSKLPCLLQIKTPNHESQTFRGSIIIKPFKDHFTVINNLDLEDYLQGVVPSEMPSSWHLEALKAQSIAARTYSMAMLGRRKHLGYDLKSTVEDQAYLGYNKETPRTNAAIQATQGELLIDNQGLYLDAYFSSDAGSYTNSPEGAWGLSPATCLIPVRELGHSIWEMRLTRSELEAKLKDLRLNSIEALTIINRSLEGRAAQLLISGTDKSQAQTEKHVLLTGEEFRHKLGLRSTNFDISYSPSLITIRGTGYGHGIGMSQHGAKYLAEHGKTYEEILGYYYRGAKLVKL